MIVNAYEGLLRESSRPETEGGGSGATCSARETRNPVGKVRHRMRGLTRRSEPTLTLLLLLWRSTRRGLLQVILTKRQQWPPPSKPAPKLQTGPKASTRCSRIILRLFSRSGSNCLGRRSLGAVLRSRVPPNQHAISTLDVHSPQETIC